MNYSSRTWDSGKTTAQFNSTFRNGRRNCFQKGAGGERNEINGISQVMQLGNYQECKRFIPFCAKTIVLFVSSLGLGAGCQGRHEEFHFVYKVASFHFVPLNLFEWATKVVPFAVLKHVAFGEVFTLGAWELNHNFAAAFWTIAYCRKQAQQHNSINYAPFCKVF